MARFVFFVLTSSREGGNAVLQELRFLEGPILWPDLFKKKLLAGNHATPPVPASLLESEEHLLARAAFSGAGF